MVRDHEPPPFLIHPRMQRYILSSVQLPPRPGRVISIVQPWVTTVPWRAGGPAELPDYRAMELWIDLPSDLVNVMSSGLIHRLNINSARATETRTKNWSVDEASGSIIHKGMYILYTIFSSSKISFSGCPFFSRCK